MAQATVTWPSGTGSFSALPSAQLTWRARRNLLICRASCSMTGEGSIPVAASARRAASRTAVPGPQPMSIIRSAGVSRAALAAARASGPRPMVIETAVMISYALLAGPGLAGRDGAFVPGIVCTFFSAPLSQGRPGEDADGQPGQAGGVQGQDQQAEGGHAGGVGQSPDGVQADGAAGQAVAHQRDGVGDRQQLGDGGEPAGQVADREQRAGEEPRGDADGRDGQPDGSGREPPGAGRGEVEGRAAQGGEGEERGELQAAGG